MFVTANIFQPLIDVFEAVLKFFHNNVGVSWGWSIVLLTVVVRAVLIPLTLKQFRSMQKLQQVAPELKAIQAKYKQDKQRQQQEVMKFYKENEVNPFASCLPLVAQLPVFIGLFYMLRTSLRHDICPALNPLHAAHTVPCGPHGHAGFLFISDLTNTAKGATLVVLIVLYVGTQLASSLMMATPTMDQTQRRIMLLMPLFFVIFVINFPAGLIVYWITTNTWTMAQQYIVRKRIGPIVPATPAGPSDDGGGGGGGPGPTTPNGSGSGSGGLTGLLRGRLRPGDDDEPAAVGSSASSRARRGAPPPPPPRKKKKRSGRRR
jgi:YidC/Oxa1 family membrane protein insertase